MPKYCKCATSSGPQFSLNTGGMDYLPSSQQAKTVRKAFGGNVFLYPGSTVNLFTGKYYALVKPEAHGLTGKWWVKPGGKWIDQDKYKKAELVDIPKSGYQCYEKRDINSHKVYKIVQSATQFNNYQVMALKYDSGWYELLWPELWGKKSAGFFKKATSDSNVSTEVSDAEAAADGESITGSSSSSGSGTVELTGSEEIVLTEEELQMIDKMLESTLQDSLKRESVFGVNYIIGSPFQFLPSADYRVYKAADEKIGESVYRNYSNYKLGRSYTENIVVEAPIVYFLPGEPSFMAGWDKAEQDVITNYITSRNSDGTEDFSKLMAQYDEDGKDFGRFYDFKGKYSEYMGCVNLLCRAAAVFLGIGDKIVPSQPANDSTNFAGDQYYKNYDWRNWGRTITLDGTVEEMNGDAETEGEEEIEKVGIFNIINKVKTFAGNVLDNLTENASEFLDTTLGDNGYFKCYIDPSSSVSEDVSNDTKTSQIAGLFDSASDLYKEAEYLLQDSGVLSGIANTAADALSSVSASAGSILSSTGFGNFGKLLGLGSQVLQGSNIAFPDMWGDSSYSRTYNITVNLVSPYGDTESIFLNTIMPMLHLLALGLPRQTSANSFTAPFIVRAFSPGIFSCDLGLVTGITVNKCPNGTDAYNVMGLPSELQVQLTIRDLYSQLSMTPAHSKSTPLLFYNNQGLIDFLGVICGLNFAQPTIIVRIKALWSIITNMVLDFPGEVYYDLLNNLANRTRGLAGMK